MSNEANAHYQRKRGRPNARLVDACQSLDEPFDHTDETIARLEPLALAHGLPDAKTITGTTNRNVTYSTFTTLEAYGEDKAWQTLLRYEFAIRAKHNLK